MILSPRNWSWIVKLYISTKKQAQRTFGFAKEMSQSRMVLAIVLKYNNQISSSGYMYVLPDGVVLNRIDL